MLPLHCAVCSTHITEEIIQALIYSNTDGPCTPDKFLRLPMHYACDSADANINTVEILSQSYADALDDEDTVRDPAWRRVRRCGADTSVWCAPELCHAVAPSVQPQQHRPGRGSVLAGTVPDRRFLCWRGECGGWPGCGCPALHVLRLRLVLGAQGGNGWLPLHYALSCRQPQLEVYTELMKVYPDGVFEADAVRCCSWVRVRDTSLTWPLRPRVLLCACASTSTSPFT